MKWINKNQNNFNSYNGPYFQKNKEKTCTYNYQNLDDMIYSFWDIEANVLKLVILGHFLPFYPLKTTKIKILKNEKIFWRYHHFTDVYQQSQPYDVRFLRCGVRQTKNFVILGYFLPFQPLATWKIKILKLKKNNIWRYYHFTHLHHKLQSSDVWFLRYGVWHT